MKANYQHLYDLLANEHGLNLTISEMDEIIREARKVAKSESLTLYLLTCGLGDYYVAATDPTEAVRVLTGTMDKTDYGYLNARKVTNIKVLTAQILERDGKPWITDDHRLIIQR